MNFFVSNVLSWDKKKGLSCVYVKIGEAQLKFLVDSGASISLIKYCKVPSKVEISKSNRMTLFGVDGKIDNRGIVHLNMRAGKLNKYQRFCVIDEIKCDVDGILGVDFMRDIGGQVDFKNDCIRVPDLNLKIEMHNINAIKEFIPQRCEKFVEIECHEKCDLVVMAGEVCEGVFTAGMIVRPIEGKIHVKVMNVNEYEVNVNNFKP